jgi:hypothetical protein
VVASAGVVIARFARSGRFGFLLLLLSALVIGAPWLQQVSDAQGFRLLFSAIYVGGVAAVSGRRAVFWVGMGLAALAIGAQWISLFTHRVGWVADHLLATLFLAYTAAVILHAILRQERVSADTIIGGLCIYLLIGIIFVDIYALVELLEPGSFAVGGKPIALGERIQYGSYAAIVYYSFVTLTTLGYGDMTPVSPAARSLAVTEAVMGQLYVAVFIARLVGLYLAGATRREA